MAATTRGYEKCPGPATSTNYITWTEAFNEWARAKDSNDGASKRVWDTGRVTKLAMNQLGELLGTSQQAEDNGKLQRGDVYYVPYILNNSKHTEEKEGWYEVLSLSPLNTKKLDGQPDLAIKGLILDNPDFDDLFYIEWFDDELTDAEKKRIKTRTRKIREEITKDWRHAKGHLYAVVGRALPGSKQSSLKASSGGEESYRRNFVRHFWEHITEIKTPDQHDVQQARAAYESLARDPLHYYKLENPAEWGRETYVKIIETYQRRHGEQIAPNPVGDFLNKLKLDPTYLEWTHTQESRKTKGFWIPEEENGNSNSSIMRNKPPKSNIRGLVECLNQLEVFWTNSIRNSSAPILSKLNSCGYTVPKRFLPNKQGGGGGRGNSTGGGYQKKKEQKARRTHGAHKFVPKPFNPPTHLPNMDGKCRQCGKTGHHVCWCPELKDDDGKQRCYLPKELHIYDKWCRRGCETRNKKAEDAWNARKRAAGGGKAKGKARYTSNAGSGRDHPYKQGSFSPSKRRWKEDATPEVVENNKKVKDYLREGNANAKTSSTFRYLYAPAMLSMLSFLILLVTFLLKRKARKPTAKSRYIRAEREKQATARRIDSSSRIIYDSGTDLNIFESNPRTRALLIRYGWQRKDATLSFRGFTGNKATCQECWTCREHTIWFCESVDENIVDVLSLVRNEGNALIFSKDKVYSLKENILENLRLQQLTHEVGETSGSDYTATVESFIARIAGTPKRSLTEVLTEEDEAKIAIVSRKRRREAENQERRQARRSYEQIEGALQTAELSSSRNLPHLGPVMHLIDKIESHVKALEVGKLQGSSSSSSAMRLEETDANRALTAIQSACRQLRKRVQTQNKQWKRSRQSLLKLEQRQKYPSLHPTSDSRDSLRRTRRACAQRMSSILRSTRRVHEELMSEFIVRRTNQPLDPHMLLHDRLAGVSSERAANSLRLGTEFGIPGVSSATMRKTCPVCLQCALSKLPHQTKKLARTATQKEAEARRQLDLNRMVEETFAKLQTDNAGSGEPPPKRARSTHEVTAAASMPRLTYEDLLSYCQSIFDEPSDLDEPKAHKVKGSAEFTEKKSYNTENGESPAIPGHEQPEPMDVDDDQPTSTHMLGVPEQNRPARRRLEKLTDREFGEFFFRTFEDNFLLLHMSESAKRRHDDKMEALVKPSSRHRFAPFGAFQMDCIGRLEPDRHGNEYILVIVCERTKATFTASFKTKDEVPAKVEALWTKMENDLHKARGVNVLDQTMTQGSKKMIQGETLLNIYQLKADRAGEHLGSEMHKVLAKRDISLKQSESGNHRNTGMVERKIREIRERIAHQLCLANLGQEFFEEARMNTDSILYFAGSSRNPCGAPPGCLWENKILDARHLRVFGATAIVPKLPEHRKKSRLDESRATLSIYLGLDRAQGKWIFYDPVTEKLFDREAGTRGIVWDENLRSMPRDRLDLMKRQAYQLEKVDKESELESSRFEETQLKEIFWKREYEPFHNRKDVFKRGKFYYRTITASERRLASEAKRPFTKQCMGCGRQFKNLNGLSRHKCDQTLYNAELRRIGKEIHTQSQVFQDWDTIEDTRQNKLSGEQARAEQLYLEHVEKTESERLRRLEEEAVKHRPVTRHKRKQDEKKKERKERKARKKELKRKQQLENRARRARGAMDTIEPFCESEQAWDYFAEELICNVEKRNSRIMSELGSGTFPEQVEDLNDSRRVHTMCDNERDPRPIGYATETACQDVEWSIAPLFGGAENVDGSYTVRRTSGTKRYYDPAIYRPIDYLTSIASEVPTPSLEEILDSENPHCKEWLKALLSEIRSMIEKKVMMPSKFPTDGETVLDSKIVMKVKKLHNRLIDKLKVRWTVRGFTDRTKFKWYETFAPTVRWGTVLAVTAFGVEHDAEFFSFDADTAFLQSPALGKPTYLEIPEALRKVLPEDLIKDGECFRLMRGIYGTKIAASLWNKFLTDALTRIGFKVSEHDPCLFLYKGGEGDESFIHLCVHVDDGLVSTNNKELWNLKLKELKKFITIKSTEAKELEEFCGILFKRQTDGSMKLTQPSYIADVLKEEKVDEYDIPEDEVLTPIDHRKGHYPCKAWMPDELEIKRDRTKFNARRQRYQEMVGKLVWALKTNPDMAHAVALLGSFAHCPGPKHIEAAKRVFLYLKKHRNKGIVFGGAKGSERDAPLMAFMDSNWDSERSTSSVYIFCFGGPIYWSSRKQSMTALSTTEAEIIAAVEGAKEVIWFKGLLKELGVEAGSVPCWEDNSACISLAESSGFRKNAKHYTARLNWLRQLVREGGIDLRKITSLDNVSDIGTKAVKPFILKRHANVSRGYEPTKEDLLVAGVHMPLRYTIS